MIVNDFISEVYIENFKCFRNFNFNNFKRVNLIGGKNNVGKTALLEALYFFSYTRKYMLIESAIGKLLLRRQKNNFSVDFFYKDSSNLLLSSDTDKSVYINFYKKKSLDTFEVLIDGYSNSTTLYDVINFLNKSEDNILNDNFITSSKIDENYLAILCSYLVETGKEQYLNNSLKLFDDNISHIERLINSNSDIILKLKVNNEDNLIPLSSLGEGISRYISIISSIWSNKNYFLFIDEIENGIHYTNYKKLWKLIFDISKEANCQVFATTHSRECIEAFNESNINNDGIYLELYRNRKTNDIVIKDRDYDALNYSLYNNGEFRGE